MFRKHDAHRSLTVEIKEKPFTFAQRSKPQMTTTFSAGRLKIAEGKYFFLPLPLALPRMNCATLLVRTTGSHERPAEHVTVLEMTR